MATNPIEVETRLVTLPGTSPPMPAIARILCRFDRHQLEGFIAIAIDLADVLDGDPDREPDGDELDGSMGEDDFCPQHANSLGYPGCPISDPDSAVDDRGNAEFFVMGTQRPILSEENVT